MQKHARTVLLLVSLAVVTPLGFLSKHYQGPLAQWVHDSSGDILYEVFWILCFGIVLPNKNPKAIALTVFGVTCLIEFFQLVQHPLLSQLRRTFLWRTLLGTTFGWLDFPHYALGCLLGFGLLYFANKSQPPVSNE